MDKNHFDHLSLFEPPHIETAIQTREYLNTIA